MGKFADRCRQVTDLYERRLQATARTAVERVVERAETVRPLGRFPIDTGFLRASGGAAIGSAPRGPSRGVRGQAYSENQQLSGQPLPVVLAAWDFSQPIIYGWTAVYARAMEARYKFMGMAVQNWDQIVADAATEMRRRIR